MKNQDFPPSFVGPTHAMSPFVYHTPHLTFCTFLPSRYSHTHPPLTYCEDQYQYNGHWNLMAYYSSPISYHSLFLVKFHRKQSPHWSILIANVAYAEEYPSF